MNDSDIFTERKIVTGLITSTEYIKAVLPFFKTKWLVAPEAKRIAKWCLRHYKLYEEAPGRQIEAIFMDAIKLIPKDQADVIEVILNDMSENEKEVNVPFLVDQTEEYFRTTQLLEFTEIAQEEIKNGNLVEAESLFTNYNPIQKVSSGAAIPLATLEDTKAAFDSMSSPLISFGSTPLGKLMDRSLVREGFVGLMGQNKVGKSWFLLNLAQISIRQGKKVVYFQAGDMTRAQQERRIAISYAGRSDLKEYCSGHYYPVLDCVRNQDGKCERKWREGGSDAPFPLSGKAFDDIRGLPGAKNPLNKNDLIKAVRKFSEHTPCRECTRRGKRDFQGSIWYKWKKAVDPLNWKLANKLLDKKYRKVLSRMRLITYASESLTMQKSIAELDLLSNEGFDADVIIYDYADLMPPDHDTARDKLRHQENKKWQRGRKLSQDRKALVIFATQSDTKGYDAWLLSKKNFSEDRRKLDHVTACFGLNQTKTEKQKGIMRVNDIVSRESAGGSYVWVGQSLQMGKPVLFSYV